VTEAIAVISHSPSLLAQLATIETGIAKLDDRLAEMNQPRDIAVSLEDLREVLHGRAAEIGALLRGDIEVARQALAKYVDRLVLTPKSTPDGPVLEVSGSVEIFNGTETGDGVCISNGGQRQLCSALHSIAYPNHRSCPSASGVRQLKGAIGF
jgi:site-specific DNA recombinase